MDIVKINLNSMEFFQAITLIEFCIKNDIDTVNATQLYTALGLLPMPNDLVWELDIPEDKLTWILLQMDYEILE
jgi:hypothetical protein